MEYSEKSQITIFNNKGKLEFEVIFPRYRKWGAVGFGSILIGATIFLLSASLAISKIGYNIVSFVMIVASIILYGFSFYFLFHQPVTSPVRFWGNGIEFPYGKLRDVIKGQSKYLPYHNISGISIKKDFLSQDVYVYIHTNTGEKIPLPLPSTNKIPRNEVIKLLKSKINSCE